ncbi:hypothetical protein JCM6882_004953 [Rhodosporidiobolus microsporus]
MSNSDKFDRYEEGIVADDSDDQVQGVLDGADAGQPAEIVDDADERSNDEFDGIKTDNIIDDSGLLSEVGQRGTRQKDYSSADREADEVVDQVSEENSGRSRVAY